MRGVQFSKIGFQFVLNYTSTRNGSVIIEQLATMTDPNIELENNNKINNFTQSGLEQSNQNEHKRTQSYQDFDIFKNK